MGGTINKEYKFFISAAGQGFGPRYADPESAVLPLDDPALSNYKEPANGSASLTVRRSRIGEATHIIASEAVQETLFLNKIQVEAQY